jgi:hypothetical protein
MKTLAGHMIISKLTIVQKTYHQLILVPFINCDPKTSQRIIVAKTENPRPMSGADPQRCDCEPFTQGTVCNFEHAPLPPLK